MKNKYFLNSYKVLYNIFSKEAYSQIELNRMLNSLEEGEDKALITKIVYGVLENNLQLEYYLSKFVKKRPKLPTYIILKIGAYACLYLNSIPSYAIVNELVELTKQESKYQEAGFVNIVLKKASQTDLELPDKEKNYLEHLNIKYSYPLWLLNKLQKEYEKDALEKLLQSKKNKLKHIRINQTIISILDFKNLLIKHNIEFSESPLKNAFYANYSKLMRVEELKNYFTAESLGSMLIVDSLDIKNGTSILDVCAAPGGKSCYMAEINNKGSVLAFDIYEHRVELINRYAFNMGVKNIITKVEDATILNKDFINKYDYVLCDAPCSGIGVVTKKPDILLFRKEDSIKSLSKLQLDILQTASNYVKVGGVLTYSTCTLLKEENIGVINEFLNKNSNFELTKLNLPKLTHINEKEAITLLPDEFNSEGYFIARMRKI
ncbi:MAG: 16S rRNA (cytosine(967)-C(5))-methyltransferase RsmB [Clostridia bacterium]|nr:16S rRNA (cytosine(967)-C(5))-methyltransferase RsmB [Clostridia bacterium]